MNYFNRNVITREQIDGLKGTLKKYIKNKIINYKNNYIDHSVIEKGMLVVDREDEIFQLIEQHLEPWLDDWWILQKQISEGAWVAYDFYKLPCNLRKYMYKVDSMLAGRWYSSIRYKASVDDYERKEQALKAVIPDFTQEEYDKYVLLGHSVPNTLGKKARDSARRSYKTVNEIIKCNMDKFEHFVTFTIASESKKNRHIQLNNLRSPDELSIEFEYINGQDFEEVKKQYSKIMNTLGTKLKRKGIPFEYIAVWEIQTNGNYHFHILCTRIPEEELYNVPEWLDMNHLEKKRYFGKGLSNWTFGKSDVQEIKDKSRLTTYVSKYIIKSFQNVREETYTEYLNKKKYFASKGLERPTVSYYAEDEDLDLDDLLVGIEPYVKVYINPYNNGLITKNHYTLVGQAD